MRNRFASFVLVASLFPALVAAQSAQRTDAAPQGHASTEPDSLATLQNKGAAASQSLWRERFGVYADMVGHGYFSVIDDFTSPAAQQDQELGFFTEVDVQWAVPGERLSLIFRTPYGLNGESVQKSVGELRWDPETRQTISPGKTAITLVVLPDGSVFSPPTSDAQGTHRNLTRVLADGSYEVSFDTLIDGRWETVRVSRLWPRTPENLERERQKRNDAYLARLAQAGIVPRHDPVWGPLASLAGSVWGARGHIIAVVDRFEWVNPGEMLKYVGGAEGFPTVEIEFRRGREPETLLGKVSKMGEPSQNVVFRFAEEGVIVSDWYRTLSTFGIGGLNQRHEIRLRPDGRYESRTAMGDGRERPEFPALHRQFRLHSEASIASIAQQSRANVEVFMQQARKDHAEAERRAKQERARRWSAVMGAVSGALDVGLEAARQQEAQSHRELDSTLADVNARIAAQQRAEQRASQPTSMSAQDAFPTPGSTLRSVAAPAVPAAAVGVRPSPASMGTPAASPQPNADRQCRTENRTFTKKSIPLSSRALAESHVHSGMAGACPLRSTPSVGPLDCTEGSEAVWGKDERGVPKVTGRRPMFTCSVTVTCSPVEVCTSTPGGGASAQ